MNSSSVSETELATQQKFLNAVAETYLLQDAILNSTELSVISTTIDGLISSFNPAAEKLLGYEHHELIGKWTPLILHDWSEVARHAHESSKLFGIPIDPGFESIVAKARLSKSADRREWTYVRKDGSRFPVILSLSGIWNENGELSGYLGIATDITEQKAAERDASKLSEEYNRIFNYTVTLNAVAGFDGLYKKLNPVWEKTLGYPVEELLSKPFVEFIHPDDVALTLRAVELLGKGLLVNSFENRYRCKDGSYRWLLWTSSSDLSHDLIYASATDITSRKEEEVKLLLSKANLESAAQELQEQNKQLDAFAHVISHNLRSPVANVGALISLLNENSPVSEYKEIFAQLKRTATSMEETLNDLMDTLKIKKASSADRMPLLFSQVLNKVKQDCAGEIIRSNASITSDFSESEKIEYNKAYLESIFLNLLSNTLKYRSPRRALQVHFKTFRQGAHTILTVSDNGLGIDLKRHGHNLFGLRQTFHEHKDAKGVGLYLTKTQVEAMGGQITMESEVEKGSTVTVCF